MQGVVLFDLDDTLIVEEAAAVAAFRATALTAAATHDVDMERLAVGARTRARELWRAAPTHPYCLRVGISSWEGLWCRYEGNAPEIRELRAWSATYRREAWRLALADQGVSDEDLAEHLGAQFAIERRARHEVFPDAEAALRALRADHAMGVITNGASCLQREKLEASGLTTYFDTVMVSADVGVAKPDPLIFRRALAELHAEGAVVVGDSATKDVCGAIAAGLRAVWLNRTGRPRPEDLDVPEVQTLAELPNLLAALS